MPERIWTVSNALSLLRVILVLPVAILLREDTGSDRIAAIVLICLAVLTDYFDGWFARRLNQVTRIGKIIDPVADKVAIAIVGIVMAGNGLMPVWFLCVVIGRDILILAGGLYIERSRRVVLVSNWPGKWAVFAIALYILVCLIPGQAMDLYRTALMLVSLLMIGISLVLYSVRAFDLLARPGSAS
jgi:CDP-diacylglycerol--glycerol-3-phosphate 3-phosphatidyltransferase